MSGFPLSTRRTILVVLFVFVGLISGEEKIKDEAHSLKLLKETVPLKKLLEKAAHDEEISSSNDVDGNEGPNKKKADQLRQYGWGWGSPSYSSAFRALGSTFSLPFSMDSERMADLVGKVSNFISEIDWKGVVHNATEFGTKHRVLRDVSEQTGVLKWVKAYKKDPIEYQCIRKVACETLAESSLVARSMKAPFGGAVLSALGIFIENGDELQSIVEDTIGNPDKCKDMAPWGFCEEDDDELNSEDN